MHRVTITHLSGEVRMEASNLGLMAAITLIWSYLRIAQEFGEDPNEYQVQVRDGEDALVLMPGRTELRKAVL